MSLVDKDYCFPGLLTNPAISGNMTMAQTSGLPGCLCLEKKVDKLANPVWAGHANDNTSRLFIALQVCNGKTHKSQPSRPIAVIGRPGAAPITITQSHHWVERADV